LWVVFGAAAAAAAAIESMVCFNRCGSEAPYRSSVEVPSSSKLLFLPAETKPAYQDDFAIEKASSLPSSHTTVPNFLSSLHLGGRRSVFDWI
jgi:hypothetical protein